MKPWSLLDFTMGQSQLGCQNKQLSKASRDQEWLKFALVRVQDSELIIEKIGRNMNCILIWNRKKNRNIAVCGSRTLPPPLLWFPSSSLWSLNSLATSDRENWSRDSISPREEGMLPTTLLGALPSMYYLCNSSALRLTNLRHSDQSKAVVSPWLEIPLHWSTSRPLGKGPTISLRVSLTLTSMVRVRSLPWVVLSLCIIFSPNDSF